MTQAMMVRQQHREPEEEAANREVFVEEIPLSSLRAQGSQLGRLAFEDRHLLPLALEVEGEICRTAYDTQGFEPLDSIRKESLADQYRLLSNVCELAELREHYAFELSPDNLYYDRNLSLRVLRRDVPCGESTENFLEQYKCLCGHILQKRYDYAVYRNGGMHLLDKHRQLRGIRAAATADSIAAALGKWSDAERAKIRRAKRLVGRKALAALLCALVFCVLLAAGSGLYAGNYLLLEQPYNQRLMQASGAYIAEDYEGVITAVQGDAIGNLPKETRYILARSYVQAESLSQQQKANILALLTLRSDDTMLDYWVELGRRNYVEARDIAQRIQNDEWLLYCLLKQEVDVRSDPSISGADKTEQLEALDREIEALGKKLDEQKAGD